MRPPTIVGSGDSSAGWSLRDLRLGYRICTYHHRTHGGTHLHHPEDSTALAILPIKTMDQARTIMEWYHYANDTFDLNRLREVIDA